MKVLKFLGVVIVLGLVATYVPYGVYACMVVQAVALWKLVNSEK